MKKALLIVTCLVLTTVTSQTKKKPNVEAFKSSNISQYATIELNGNIKNVFPLFGAFEERKWAEGWYPEVVYPNTELLIEGTAFYTKGNEVEQNYLWIVTKYNPEKYFIQYLVSTTNRFWTIDVSCKKTSEDKTEATVTYSYTSLNSQGHSLNVKGLEAIYSQNLINWQNAINTYLKKHK
jgi:hypothetical protein